MLSSDHKRPASGKGTFLTLCLTGLVATCAIILFAAKPENLSLLGLAKEGILEREARGGQVRCSVVSSAGTGHIRIKLAIPYRHPRQREELTSKMPRLQHDFVMAMSRPEMGDFIKGRNFEGMRRQFLQVVNTHLKEPVENIYFEGFFQN